MGRTVLAAAPRRGSLLRGAIALLVAGFALAPFAAAQQPPVSVTPEDPSSESPVPRRVLDGDLSGDGVLDLADAMLALRIASGRATASPEQLQRGDVAPLPPQLDTRRRAEPEEASAQAALTAPFARVAPESELEAEPEAAQIGVGDALLLMRAVRGDDVDGDGLATAEEREVGASPFRSDSDGDGTGDAEELRQRRDPARPDAPARPFAPFRQGGGGGGGGSAADAAGGAGRGEAGERERGGSGFDFGADDFGQTLYYAFGGGTSTPSPDAGSGEAVSLFDSAYAGPPREPESAADASSSAAAARRAHSAGDGELGATSEATAAPAVTPAAGAALSAALPPVRSSAPAAAGSSRLGARFAQDTPRLALGLLSLLCGALGALLFAALQGRSPRSAAACAAAGGAAGLIAGLTGGIGLSLGAAAVAALGLAAGLLAAAGAALSPLRAVLRRARPRARRAAAAELDESLSLEPDEPQDDPHRDGER